MTKELEPLKECAHCGKTRTLELTDCVDVEACSHFEECHSDHAKCVVCNVNKGGCGASGGFAYTEEEAIRNWNTRYKRTCTNKSQSERKLVCSKCGCTTRVHKGEFDRACEPHACGNCMAVVVDG